MLAKLSPLSAVVAFASIAFAVPAYAEPGDSSSVSGEASVTIAEPLRVQPLEDLRFGAFLRPPTAGTIIIGSNGSVSGTTDISAYPGNRGPARFDMDGEGARLFILRLPNSITISNGSATMRVDRFEANTFVGIIGRFNASGHYDLRIGGRLNVNANQATGEYSGTFEFTVLYL